MEIKTKLNIGQQAWFIHKNEVRKEKVMKITINVSGVVGTKGLDITYVVGDLYNMTEGQLFASKEDLLKSL